MTFFCGNPKRVPENRGAHVVNSAEKLAVIKVRSELKIVREKDFGGS